MKRNLTASLMLLLTAMVWGFSVVAQVLGADHLPAMTFNGTRFLLGAVCLIPVYLVAEREQDLDKAARRTRHIKTARAALVGGCLLAVASALQQTGAGIVRDPGKTGFITGLYTVLTPVFYFLVFRRKSSWNTWVGVGLAVLGLYLLCAKGGDGPLFGEGEIFLLVGVLFWAAHILAVDRLVGDVSVLRFSSWQFLVTGVLNLAAGLVVERGEVTAEGFRGAFGAILFCGILSVGVGFTFQILGQKHASNPTFAAIILSSESVFSIIGALLWNRFTPESLHVSQDIQPLGYVGCACILAAIVLSQLNFRSRAKTVAHSSTVHHAGK